MPRAVYPRKRVPALDRVLNRCVPADGGCIVFTGALKNGYGIVQLGRGIGTGRTHRVVYEAMVGPIPPGMTIDHLCANTRCCNPAHLEVVTRAENARRQWRDGRADPGRALRERTHCNHGHEFTAANTYITPRGARACRACTNRRALRRYHEQKRRNQ